MRGRWRRARRGGWWGDVAGEMYSELKSILASVKEREMKFLFFFLIAKIKISNGSFPMQPYHSCKNGS